MNDTVVLYSYCKYVENSPVLEFGNGPEYFNGTRCGTVYRAGIRKQLTDSLQIVVEQVGKYPSPLAEFKLTNQSITTWDDYWVDDERVGEIIDPRIRKMNLQRNRLVYVNINTPRLELTELNLEGNTELRHLYLHEVPKLEILDISNCTSLEYVSLGMNKSLRSLTAKGCQMSESAMEQLLRDFTPTVCASANVSGVGMFRKQHNTVLDLRGNVIPWGNRRISSKIRMLLVNNWVVKWDNNPPSEVVPPQLYGFFVESLLEN